MHLPVKTKTILTIRKFVDENLLSMSILTEANASTRGHVCTFFDLESFLFSLLTFGFASTPNNQSRKENESQPKHHLP